MTEARKARIWSRENGICWICKKPVAHTGPGVRYDHYSPIWISHDDSDENLFPLHTECDATKTYGKDLGDIAKIKRLRVKHGVDEDKRKAKRQIPSRPFAKAETPRKIPSRKFDRRPER